MCRNGFGYSSGNCGSVLDEFVLNQGLTLFSKSDVQKSQVVLCTPLLPEPKLNSAECYAFSPLLETVKTLCTSLKKFF